MLAPEQLHDSRQRLMERARELGAELRDAEDDRRDAFASPTTDTTVGDSGEQGEQRTREMVRHGEEARDDAELDAIDDALVRLDEGRYGECIDCGGDIPWARLRVQPTAARCVACQARSESGAARQR